MSEPAERKENTGDLPGGPVETVLPVLNAQRFLTLVHRAQQLLLNGVPGTDIFVTSLREYRKGHPMREADKKDSKLNRKLSGAARAGARKTGSAIRSVWRRFLPWQKIGLAVCLVFWILSALIGFACGRFTGSMKDQNFASRWSPENDSSQVSAFISDASLISDDTIKELRTYFNSALTAQSLVLSEEQTLNGASLMDVSYCGIGAAEVSTASDSVAVTAIGVGGDFFNFHPLELLTGYYFSEAEPMRDRILLDDRTAWRLFGSANIVGMSVNIGGTPHYVAGVFRAPQKRFYNQAGMGEYLIYMTYDSLCRYTESMSGSSSEEGDIDTSMMDALLTPRERKSITAFSSIAGVPAAGQRISFISRHEGVSAVILPAAARQPFLTAFAAGLGGVDNLGDVDVGDGTDDSGGADSDSLPGSSLDKTDTAGGEDDGADADDTPVGADRSEMGNYRGNSSVDDGGDGGQQQEIDRSRINCFEVILPDPISGFALRTTQSCLSSSGLDMSQVTVVDNTHRFDKYRLALMLARPGLRSMQTAPIRYPYWENVALAWEDVLVPVAFAQLFMRFSPFLFLLFLVLWYSTHKSWTLTGAIQIIQDRIYDRESERIYGKWPAPALPGDSELKTEEAGAEDSQELPLQGSGNEDSPEQPSDGAGTQAGPELPQEDAGTGSVPVLPPEGSGTEDSPEQPSEGAGSVGDSELPQESDGIEDSSGLSREGSGRADQADPPQSGGQEDPSGIAEPGPDPGAGREDPHSV